MGNHPSLPGYIIKIDMGRNPVLPFFVDTDLDLAEEILDALEGHK